MTAAIDRPVVENSQYAQFARRIMRAFARRAGSDIDTLPDLAAIVQDADTCLRLAVASCRDEGYSWSEIAARLGTTKQAAQQRYGRPAGAA
jgi:hypothetical protein